MQTDWGDNGKIQYHSLTAQISSLFKRQEAAVVLDNAGNSMLFVVIFSKLSSPAAGPLRPAEKLIFFP
jgi:hypothetical protein